MIELSANNHLVSEQGREASLDVDGVRREVRDCCLAVGVQETWLAEQMELALDDFFLSREDRGETGVPARGEIDALVARLLMSAGYRDVAAEYSRRRQIRSRPVADATLWDAARIRRLRIRRLLRIRRRTHRVRLPNQRAHRRVVPQRRRRDRPRRRPRPSGWCPPCPR